MQEYFWLSYDNRVCTFLSYMRGNICIFINKRFIIHYLATSTSTSTLFALQRIFSKLRKDRFHDTIIVA